MGEVTTRRRTPPPSNTRKLIEADAGAWILPESSTSHTRRPSTNFLQVRDEPEFILHDLAGPCPVQNSPSTPGSAAQPVQNSPSEPQNADFGPFFACRENYLPLPPPTRRARRKVTHQHPTSCIMPRSAHITGTIHGLRTLSGHIPAGTSINARCRHSNDSPATRLRPTQNPRHRVREGHQRPHLSSTSESPV